MSKATDVLCSLDNNRNGDGGERRDEGKEEERRNGRDKRRIEGESGKGFKLLSPLFISLGQEFNLGLSIPALGRQKQVDFCEFQAILTYTEFQDRQSYVIERSCRRRRRRSGRRRERGRDGRRRGEGGELNFKRAEIWS